MSSQKQSRLLVVLLIGALAFSACNLNAAATPTETSLEAVYTAAAGTVMAQLTGAAAVAQPTATLIPTATVTGTPTPTAVPIVTLTPGNPAPVSGGSGAVGCNNAIFVDDVTYRDGAVVAPGQAFTKTWRLQNNGTCAWNTNYKLAFVNGEAMSGAATALTQTVNAGSTVDISVSMVAPSTPKSYTGYWRMVNDSGQAFGMSIYVQVVVSGASVTPGTGTVTGTVLPSITPTFGAVGCYNSVVITETIPDGTKINPGQSFTKTWTVKNTGTCEWTADFKLVSLTDAMGSDTFKIRRKVAPNETTDFSVNMVASNYPGTYTGIWRLCTDDGTLFGSSLSVRIVVPGSTATPSITPSITLTPTPVPATKTPTAPANTPTGTPTETPRPPDTETPTPTATAG